MSQKTYELVTSRIIELLEKGKIPWRQPWHEGASIGEHQNLISQHGYRGINAMLTAAMGYESPYWLTYKQALDHGGRVKPGERGTPIVFWKFGSKEVEGSDKEKSYAFCKYSTVFNLEQVEGLDSVKALASKRKAKRIEFKPIEACDRIVKGYLESGPTLDHKEQRAWYKPGLDLVNMPKPDSFKSPELYYSVLFHELTHSTGHGTRLARSGITDRASFASHEYSKEELIAEMGAAFLCGVTGIDNTLEVSAAYIQSWLKALKNDPKLVLAAASGAQKAADLIQGKKPEEKKE